MTERDIQNLKFLLTAGEEKLILFYDTATPKQILYAMDLLNVYYNEINAYEIEEKLYETNLLEAKQVLSKFTNKI